MGGCARKWLGYRFKARQLRARGDERAIFAHQRTDGYNQGERHQELQ
jgi:hypothetical protein